MGDDTAAADAAAAAMSEGIGLHSWGIDDDDDDGRTAVVRSESSTSAMPASHTNV